MELRKGTQQEGREVRIREEEKEEKGREWCILSSPCLIIIPKPLHTLSPLMAHNGLLPQHGKDRDLLQTPLMIRQRGKTRWHKHWSRIGEGTAGGLIREQPAGWSCYSPVGQVQLHEPHIEQNLSQTLPLLQPQPVAALHLLTWQHWFSWDHHRSVSQSTPGCLD